MSDGEDYELLFAVAPPVQKKIAKTTMIEIGKVVARDLDDSRLVVVRAGSEFISADEFGWQHDSASSHNET